jgi:MerR family mercuric resistance operon transcriptional regulator
MLIGELAAQAGVNIQTVRFYERRGLLKPPKRLSSSYRDYPSETIEIIKFIKRNQQSGFTLKEIKMLLEKLAKGAPEAMNRQTDVRRKIEEIDDQIRSLQTARDRMKEKLEECICNDGVTPCPGAKDISEALRKR